METRIRANSITENLMDTASNIIPTAKFMREHGRMVRKKVLVNGLVTMVTRILVNGRIIKLKVTASTSKRMVINIKDIG